MAFNLPWFKVRLDDVSDEREWQKTQGWDPEGAAADFVDKWNHEAGNYPDDGDSVPVVVRDQEGRECRIFVYAHRSITYTGIKEADHA
jgi:hypothetical protein